jgi:hypothetical protein
MNATSSGAILAVLACVVAAGSAGCGAVPAQAYGEYFEAHRVRFCREVVRNGVAATVCYIPAEVYAAREIVSGSGQSVEDGLMRYRNSLFFVVSIAGTNGASPLLQREGPQGYKTSVAQNTFERESAFVVVAGSDTVAASSYRFERGSHLGTADAFVVAFSAEDVRKLGRKAVLRVRDLVPELGTVEVAVGDIVRKPRKLRS